MIKVCEHILMIVVIICTKFLMLMILFLLMRGPFQNICHWIPVGLLLPCEDGVYLSFD